MANPKKPTSLGCSLLDLPEAVLNTIITGLHQHDKRSFMPASKKAFHMTTLTADTTLEIGKGAKFTGIKQVLNSIPADVHVKIMCPRNSEGRNAVHTMPVPALAMFLGMLPENYLRQAAASCHWDRITKITIQGTNLNNVVPPFIALACPQLTQLNILRPRYDHAGPPLFKTGPREAMPLAVCSSLRQLRIQDTEKPIVLPEDFHGIEDLRDNLPNVDTLMYGTSRQPNLVLIEAFATQLMRLEICYSFQPALWLYQQGIGPCSNLQHLIVPAILLPDNTGNLRILDLQFDPSDDDFERVLQLTSLTELRLPNLYKVHKDWNDHPCSWQTLHISGILQFDALARLNLRSLKKLSTGPDVVIELPNPAHPNSLAAVQRAADNLAHVGQLVVYQSSTRASSVGQRESILFRIVDRSRQHEQAAAELAHIAAQHIGPCRACDCTNLFHRPLVLKQVLDWGRSFIESVTFGMYSDLQQFPQIWSELLRLPRLDTVAFHYNIQYDDPYLNSKGEEYAYEMFLISSQVCLVAQHYVIPANKRLSIECESSGNVMEGAVTECRVFLKRALEEVLPDGCKVSSIEFHTLYGKSSVQSSWVVVVEPTQTNAHPCLVPPVDS